MALEFICTDKDGHKIGITHDRDKTRVWIAAQGLGVIDLHPNQALALGHYLREYAYNILKKET